jgi:hypothetical protein
VGLSLDTLNRSLQKVRYRGLDLSALRRPKHSSAVCAVCAMLWCGPLQRSLATRYRTGGEQRLTVTHLTVNDGGQAIVGSVQSNGGHPRQEVEEQPRAVTNSPGIEMPSSPAGRETVPISEHAERSVPDARRHVAGGSKGK